MTIPYPGVSVTRKMGYVLRLYFLKQCYFSLWYINLKRYFIHTIHSSQNIRNMYRSWWATITMWTDRRRPASTLLHGKCRHCNSARYLGRRQKIFKKTEYCLTFWHTYLSLQTITKPSKQLWTEYLNTIRLTQTASNYFGKQKIDSTKIQGVRKYSIMMDCTVLNHNENSGFCKMQLDIKYLLMKFVWNSWIGLDNRIALQSLSLMHHTV